MKISVTCKSFRTLVLLESVCNIFRLWNGSFNSWNTDWTTICSHLRLKKNHTLRIDFYKSNKVRSKMWIKVGDEVNLDETFNIEDHESVYRERLKAQKKETSRNSFNCCTLSCHFFHIHWQSILSNIMSRAYSPCRVLLDLSAFQN